MRIKMELEIIGGPFDGEKIISEHDKDAKATIFTFDHDGQICAYHSFDMKTAVFDRICDENDL